MVRRGWCVRCEEIFIRNGKRGKVCPDCLRKSKIAKLKKLRERPKINTVAIHEKRMKKLMTIKV